MGIEVALVAAVAGAVAQGVEGRKQAKQQEVQGQQRAVDMSQRTQQRRADFRKRRMAAARIRQAGENTGTAGSSAEAGALGSLATGAAQSQANIATGRAASEGTGKATSRIAQSQTRSSIFESVQSIASAGAYLEGTDFDIVQP